MTIRLIGKRTGNEVRRFEYVEDYELYPLAYRIEMVIGEKVVRYQYGGYVNVVIDE